MKTLRLTTLLCIATAVLFLTSCTEKNQNETPQSDFLKTFLSYTDLGLYGKNAESFTYMDYSSQYSSYTYNNGETAAYRILTTSPALYMTVSNVPKSIKPGTTYELTISQNYTQTISETVVGQFSVEKVLGTTVWMFDHENEYGIIILTD